MTRQQYADQDKLPLYKLDAIIDHFNKGLPINDIIVELNVGYSRVYRALAFYFETLYTNEQRPMIAVPKQYYQTEDEMLIQDYRAEDLTGDELIILNKLFGS